MYRQWINADDPECHYAPQDVAKLAQEMIEEIEHNTPERINEDQYHPNHAGHYAASWIYPRADALGYACAPLTGEISSIVGRILGWFHLRLSKTVKTPEDEKIHLAAAAKNYMEAAEGYPPDDEFSA